MPLQKSICYLTIAIVTIVATVALWQNSALWQPVQHTWSTGTAEVVTRAGRHQTSGYPVADKLERQWLRERFPLVLKTNCIRQPKGQLPS